MPIPNIVHFLDLLSFGISYNLFIYRLFINFVFGLIPIKSFLYYHLASCILDKGTTHESYNIAFPAYTILLP